MGNPEIKQTREELLNSCSGELFDIVIIGGGIHGANLARLAALCDFKTLLLEASDYAAETSSRSSKMAHGGLRYLELGDFQQVFEGIKARENLFEYFPYMVRPYPFLIPVPKGHHFQKFKLKLGLWLYDLMVQKKERKHRWIPRQKLNFEGFDSNRSDLEGCFKYTDGILSDARLVFENIFQARANGAICLNYAEVIEVGRAQNNITEVNWQNKLTGQSVTTNAKIVINCAGPWAPFIKRTFESQSKLAARYSQGTHLLFDRKWNSPALFLPMEGKARYYFVWPHYSGTMVGTTEREVSKLEPDPVPQKDEIEEILARIEKDLPDSGLNRASLHYAFAGVRTLPMRDNSGETGRLSRKHIWSFDEGMLSLLGGKLTTAEWTAWEGLKLAAKAVAEFKMPTKMPRFFYKDSSADEFIEKARRLRVPEDKILRLLNQFGARALDVIQTDQDSSLLGGDTLKGELRYALEVEQAETIEDVMRRRLELEYQAGNGLDLLPAVVEAMKLRGLERDLDQQFVAYSTHVNEILSLLGKTDGAKYSKPTHAEVSPNEIPNFSEH